MSIPLEVTDEISILVAAFKWMDAQRIVQFRHRDYLL